MGTVVCWGMAHFEPLEVSMVAVVLLGAGASYGSGPAHPGAPPLGSGKNGLFDRLLEHGGMAASFPPDLQDLFRSNFEEGMAKYEQSVHGDINAFHRYMARYLLQFMPAEGNEYFNLIRSLGCKRVVYSTLNYDVMFECAAAVLGYPIPKYEVGIARSGPTLLKLHGSANFWPDNSFVLKGCTFNDVGVFVNTPIRFLNREEAMRECLEQDSISPAMCMYVAGKQNKVCKTAVDGIVQQWTEVVSKATSIFVSGVAVNIVDRHIWEPLGRAKAKIFYYGFDADAPHFEAWKAAFDKRDAFFRKAGFREAVPFMRRELFG